MNAPLYPEGKFEHFDAPHEVDLDIIERAAFAFKECDTRLV
jgi:hypothetical protein